MTDMTKQTEAISTERALKLALEALEIERNVPRLGPVPTKTSKAITALREALTSVPDWASEAKEQPAQQEPKKDLMYSTVAMQERHAAFVDRAVATLEQAKREALEKQPAQQITEAQVEAALKAAHMHSTPESRKDMRRAIEATAPQPAQPQQEPVACIIGTKGSAFDLPTTKRAYTYAEQPGNVVAYKIGRACEAAMKQSAGDGIDRGLAMLQELQKEGLGVFDLGAEYADHGITKGGAA